MQDILPIFDQYDVGQIFDLWGVPSGTATESPNSEFPQILKILKKKHIASRTPNIRQILINICVKYLSNVDKILIKDLSNIDQTIDQIFVKYRSNICQMMLTIFIRY